MHVYVSQVGRLDSQILSSLTMAVTTDTYLFITIAILLWIFIIKITWEFISYVYTVFYQRQLSVLIIGCHASWDWKNICGNVVEIENYPKKRNKQCNFYSVGLQRSFFWRLEHLLLIKVFIVIWNKLVCMVSLVW